MGGVEIPNSEFRIPNSSDRVRQVDELHLEFVAVRDPTSEGANTEALGGIVARSNVVNPILGRLVHDPL